MIINYGINPDIVPFIRCNEIMHDNKEHPVFMQPAYIGTAKQTELYSITPYATKKTQSVEEFEVVKKNLFGKVIQKKSMPVTHFEPIEDSRGFAFVSTENRKLCKTLCFVPVINNAYNPYPNEKPSKYNPTKAHFNTIHVALDPKLLMPIISNQPKTIQDAIALVCVDPRFLQQLDPSVCKSEADVELLTQAAKKGYDSIMSYQDKLGVKSPLLDVNEAAERKDFAKLCTESSNAFVANYNKSIQQTNTNNSAKRHA